MFCGRTVSQAMKAYQKRLMMVMAAYLLTVFGVTYQVHRYHPQGWELWALAALPTVPVIAMLATIGRYLREERDEFQRDILIKAILFATACTLSVTTFASFLRGFGWNGALPPFADFVGFFTLFALAKTFLEFKNRVRDDDEPSA